MGAGLVHVAVADAGPLIHLHEVGCFTLLTCFEELHVPDVVLREAGEHKRVPRKVISSLPRLVQHIVTEPEITTFLQSHDLAGLHAGELACLYLCEKMAVDLLLTDDLAVREAAKRLRVTPVGSLGVVARAFRLGRISLTDAERYIVALYEVSSLFVTRTVAELAIEQLRKHLKLHGREP